MWSSMEHMLDTVYCLCAAVYWQFVDTFALRGRIVSNVIGI